MMRLGRQTILLLGLVGALSVASGQTPPAPTAAATDPGVAAPSLPVAPAAASPALETNAPVGAEVTQLRAELERLVRNLSTRNSKHAVLVVSLDRGDTLFSHNPDLPLAPASNMKLFSTAAALYYLGPNFRYSTYVLADGPIEEGVLHGDLVLYGTGDPAISSRMLSGTLTPLRALADSIAAHGIREIRGDIVGDGSYFDDSWIGEGWKEEYRLDSYSAPVGALSLGENVVSVRVLPGGAAGQPAQVRTTPETNGLLIHNRVTTAASGSSSVRFSYDPSGLVIQGQIARGHPGVARSVTVVDPANFAASAFRRILEGTGVAISGGVRTVRSREGSPIGATAVSAGEAPPRILGIHLSPTLAEVTAVTNHVSQNLFAESLFKTVGRVALGDGSFSGGALAVRYLLECEKPIDFSLLQIVDGSGLSPINRVTPRATVHLLDLMRRTDVWETFYRSLPEAASPQGGQHSLRGRMGGTAAARNLRAKTGTIANVSSLSGYVHAANGELIAFSIFANDVPSTGVAKRTEDAIGIRLAQFTRPPQRPEPEVVGAPVTSTIPDSLADPTQVESMPTEPASTLTPPLPVDSAPAPAPRERTHRVASGDTFDGIARRYGTTAAELQRLNPEVQPRRLQIGQSIQLPAQ